MAPNALFLCLHCRADFSEIKEGQMSLDSVRSEAEAMCRFILSSEAVITGISPGCISLLGVPASFGQGAALTLLVDRYTVVSGKKSAGTIVSVYADAYERLLQFDTFKPVRDGTAPWLDFVMGVVDQIHRSGRPLGGFEASICSNLPFQVGMASSSSLLVALTRYLDRLFDLSLSAEEVMVFCQGVEASRSGGAVNSATLRAMLSPGRENLFSFAADGSLSGSAQFPSSFAQWVLASVTKTEECDELDASSTSGGCGQGQPTKESSRLARYQQEEEKRIRDCMEAFQRGDLSSAGALLTESHSRYRDSLEGISQEQELLYCLSLEQKSCYGSRLIDSGSGRSTIHLIAREDVESFCQEMTSGFEGMSGGGKLELIPLETGEASWAEEAGSSQS